VQRRRIESRLGTTPVHRSSGVSHNVSHYLMFSDILVVGHFVAALITIIASRQLLS